MPFPAIREWCACGDDDMGASKSPRRSEYGTRKQTCGLTRSYIYSFPTVARKRITRFDGDIREHPRYSIEEAAAYLHIPLSTMKAWTRGQRYTTKSGKRIVFQAVLGLADQRRGLLSFYNLAE